LLRIWGRPNSINVQKVLWTAAELGLDLTLIQTGGAFGGTDSAEFRRMNANGLVPVIDDDGFVLWESNSIVRYLAAKHGGGLYPEDLRARASAERWMDWQSIELWRAIGPVFHSLVRTRPEGLDDAGLERAVALSETRVGIAEAQLGRHDFIDGDVFGMADIPIGATLARWTKLPREAQPCPNVRAYLDRLRERPAFRSHVDLPLS
jgi:glutathione S-transferase